jgi:hypothetical protein
MTIDLLTCFREYSSDIPQNLQLTGYAVQTKPITDTLAMLEQFFVYLQSGPCNNPTLGHWGL